MNDMPQPRRSLWRFSLREMLLLMVAIGAVLALWLHQRPLRPTNFYRRFDLVSSLDAFYRPGQVVPSVSGIRQTHSGSPQRVADRHELVLSGTPGACSQLTAHFLKLCEAELAREKCTIEFRGLIGDESAPGGFVLLYRQNQTRGSFCVYTAAAGDDAIKLQVMRTESRD